MLIFPKTVEIGGRKASGNSDEHVIESEAKDPRVPSATQKWGIFQKEVGHSIYFKKLAVQGLLKVLFPPLPRIQGKTLKTPLAH